MRQVYNNLNITVNFKMAKKKKIQMNVDLIAETLTQQLNR